MRVAQTPRLILRRSQQACGKTRDHRGLKMTKMRQLRPFVRRTYVLSLRAGLKKLDQTTRTRRRLIKRRHGEMRNPRAESKSNLQWTIRTG